MAPDGSGVPPGQMREMPRYRIANPARACTVLGVGPFRHLFPLVCLFALVLSPARSAVLIHDFTLRGTLADSLPGPSLVAMGGQITALGYVAVQSQGLSLTSPSLTVANYSVEFTFRLNSANGNMKLLDLHGLTDTTGLYQDNGRLTFAPGAAAATASITSGTDLHVVLTRDSVTNQVRGFLNGQQVFAFTDATGVALVAPNRELNFFRDNFNLSPADPVGGTIQSIRIYNGALTASEVSGLYAVAVPLPIPEPSVVALLLTGLAAVAFLRRGGRKS